MEWQKNGAIRLSKRQITDLASAVSHKNVEMVELSEGADGRLIVKEVQTVERLKALKISK
jgi:hypothetical protein